LLAAGLLQAFVAGAPAHAAGADRAPILCGWFDNPTPGNAWLTDRDGEWTLGTQGGEQAEGDWPDFAADRWVETNGSHGHGCACMRVVADREAREIRRILAAWSRPLSACRQDRQLRGKEPGP
jgi:hypothetical protein